MLTIDRNWKLSWVPLEGTNSLQFVTVSPFLISLYLTNIIRHTSLISVKYFVHEALHLWTARFKSLFVLLVVKRNIYNYFLGFRNLSFPATNIVMIISKEFSFSWYNQIKLGFWVRGWSVNLPGKVHELWFSFLFYMKGEVNPDWFCFDSFLGGWEKFCSFSWNQNWQPENIWTLYLVFSLPFYPKSGCVQYRTLQLWKKG